MFAVCLIKDYHGEILLVETKEEADAKVVDHVNFVTGENFQSFDEYFTQDQISLDSGDDWHVARVYLPTDLEDYMAVWEQVLELQLFRGDGYQGVAELRTRTAAQVPFLSKLYEEAGCDQGFDTEFVPWALTRFFYADFTPVYTYDQALKIVEAEFNNPDIDTEEIPYVIAYDTMCGGLECWVDADDRTPSVYYGEEAAEKEIQGNFKAKNEQYAEDGEEPDEEPDEYVLMLCEYLPGRKAVWTGGGVLVTRRAPEPEEEGEVDYDDMPESDDGFYMPEKERPFD